MGFEIERKFVVKALPKALLNEPGHAIAQGYLMADGEGNEVRLRQKNHDYYQTIKRGHGLVRQEVEIALQKEQFDQLWPLTEGKRLSKTRYYLQYGGHTVEVDTYHGTLEGLIVAEVEFANVEEANAFEPPAWFAEEVTENEAYRNRALALVGILPG